MTVVNHIFVDFENMKKIDTALFALERATTVTLFLGRQNHSLDTTTVGALLKAPRAVELIRIEREGRDAVDFTLVFYLGRKAALEPTAFFHIVSKDKGYDALIEHLKAQKTKVNRHDDFASLFKALKPVASTSSKKTTLSKTV